MPEMAQREALITSVRAAETQPDPHRAEAIPPWVHANDEDEQEKPLISPTHAVPNTRHYKPPAHYKPGRKWDHFRSAEPPLLSIPIAESQERWKTFMQSGPNYPDEAEGRVVDAAWMEENMPDLNPNWQPEDESHPIAHGLTAKGLMYKGKWLISPERQEKTVRIFWRILLKNAYMPLIFRVTVLAFSIAALAISAAIFIQVKHVNADDNPNNQCATRASTFMGLSVGSVAVPYIAYVTWDEYMSKPLGLRSVAAKILLLLCDLYFVVFTSSNVSLALDARFDHRWACYDLHVQYQSNTPGNLEAEATCPNNPGICYKQKALSGVLIVSLIAWCVTFSISVLRVVERLRPD